MPAAPRRPPLDGTDRVIVDGTNLLYRLGAASGGPAPPSAIVGRMRGAIPVTVAIDLVFDGVGQGVYGRLAQNMYVRWSGKRTADETILDLVSEAAMHGGAAVDKVLVISNDRPLRDKAMAKGARSIQLQWLIERLGVPMAASGQRRGASIGAGRPPAGGPAGVADDGDERPGWKPGRGATSKVGPPKKVARHKRHPR